ncbi:helix-turn-helix domain-containing protein [Lactobacillus taiwanensis]|uniref:helix-turn-helix domain-containing protein n=1 Tax=Lactobacillus taiwanensis TaxID=508451 RepID=UPI00214BAF5C|nr:helix-turn-helix transcriptional regulator [Lactobacillus taiwanensis]MCR1904326.1 helix-turn-helix domain-containing protein [Lactobacillus taiwanensis]
MKKTKSIAKPQYLKKTVVMAYLKGTGKSQTQLEDELGWGHGSLSKYLTYKNLIPPERLYQLAKAIGFGSTASYLVQYNPTTAMEEVQRVTALHRKKSKLDEEHSSEQAVPNLNGSEMEQIKTLLINITGAIQQNSNLMHKIVSLCSTNKDEIIGSVQSLQERAERQHAYIQSQVKDTKKVIKEMWS